MERPGIFKKVRKFTGKGYGHRPHGFITETQTLEDACDVIAAYQRMEKAKIARAEAVKGKTSTLRQQFAQAKLRAINQKITGKISLAGGMTSKRHTALIAKPKPPHPLRDLPDDQKRLKAIKMADSGCWGTGTPRARRLAKAFGVGLGQMMEWLDDALT